ncbi:hypothetical protein ACFW3D_16680 [Streptomyces sp. NPDC058864]
MLFLLPLVLLLTGLVTAIALTGHALGALRRPDVRCSGRDVRLRTLAALLGAGSVALYTWGLLHVAGAVIQAEDGGAGSAPLRPCSAPDRWGQTVGVVDYAVDYVPLRFVCTASDGSSHTSATVPGYVNPAVLGLALTAVVCAGAAALESERRALQEPAGAPSGSGY